MPAGERDSDSATRTARLGQLDSDNTTRTAQLAHSGPCPDGARRLGRSPWKSQPRYPSLIRVMIYPALLAPGPRPGNSASDPICIRPVKRLCFRPVNDSAFDGATVPWGAPCRPRHDQRRAGLDAPPRRGRPCRRPGTGRAWRAWRRGDRG